jgi:hypothetical protein
MAIFNSYVKLPEGIPGEERPEKGGCNDSMFQAWRPGGFSRGSAWSAGTARLGKNWVPLSMIMGIFRHLWKYFEGFA